MDNKQLYTEMRKELVSMGFKFDRIVNWSNNGKDKCSFKLVCQEDKADIMDMDVFKGDPFDKGQTMRACDILFNLARKFPKVKIVIKKGLLIAGRYVPHIRIVATVVGEAK